METIPMATNKKKPNNLMHIWFSLMKAAFYSFLISERLGRPKGKRRCIITPMSEVRFQQSEQFQFLQRGSIWYFISSSIKETSTVWILKIFSATYSSTYTETSFYYGMVLRYTGVMWLKNIYNSIQGCRLKSSPAMRQSLNPAEYIWNQADRELSNSSPEDLQQLETLLSNSANRLSNSQQLLWSCIYASDLPWKRE